MAGAIEEPVKKITFFLLFLFLYALLFRLSVDKLNRRHILYHSDLEEFSHLI